MIKKTRKYKKSSGIDEKDSQEKGYFWSSDLPKSCKATSKTNGEQNYHLTCCSTNSNCHFNVDKLDAKNSNRANALKYYYNIVQQYHALESANINWMFKNKQKAIYNDNIRTIFLPTDSLQEKKNKINIMQTVVNLRREYLDALKDPFVENVDGEIMVQTNAKKCDCNDRDHEARLIFATRLLNLMKSSLQPVSKPTTQRYKRVQLSQRRRPKGLTLADAILLRKSSGQQKKTRKRKSKKRYRKSRRK